MTKRNVINSLIVVTILLIAQQNINAEVLCKNKKSGAIKSRATSCTSKEVLLSNLTSTANSTESSAAVSSHNGISVTDTGAVTSGADINNAFDIVVSRSGATGGTIQNNGLSIDVVGDTGGSSTNIGLYVSTSGADNNYCAIFDQGNVGIGVTDPDEKLEVAGRIHLGRSSFPTVATDKLYNINGDLYWNGQEVAVTSSLSSGDITSVTAGSGLTGGGSSGAVTLSVNSGTTANKIVSLNSSAELPAVSGVNLTALNASNISSGSLSDARLSANVSLLGSAIGLTTEVAGVLPIANGGTGVNSLSNFLTLGTQTTGNYVATLATGSGLSGGSVGTEAAEITLTVDQSFSPTWTGNHSFQNSVNVGTTTASVEKLHLNGRLHIEPDVAPATTTNKLYNVGGALFFNGQDLTAGALGGDILGVTAGAGLTGGGTSGTVTLTVDTGTAAGKIVALDGSARLPAVSGVNLTALNASNIDSGTLSDGRLSANVSLLGSSVALTSEVTGTLPIANGGTGVTSLVNFLTLGTHTDGNYVAAVANGTGISLSSTGAEGGTATLSLNQAVTPTWTGTHTFSTQATDITTAANEDFAIMPNGTGKVGIGTTAPSAMLDTTLSVTSTTAANDVGAEITISDTGVVNAGADNTIGQDINITRTGATGGTITTTGIDLDISADTGATSLATGIDVNVSGADTNYAALFNGGHVGIGTTTPQARLDTNLLSTSTNSATEIGTSITVTDTGVVSAGTDETVGLEIDLDRTGAGGASTVNSTGIDISVNGDSGGTSLVKGLEVEVSGADNNIAAQFSGGKVGIGSLNTTVINSSNIPNNSLILENGALCIDNGGDDCDNAGRVAGTIYANNTTVASVDVAEEFPIENNDVVEAGDIVIANTKVADKCSSFAIGTEGSKVCAAYQKGYVPFVTKSSGATGENKRILGIVSTEPGLTLGGFGQHELLAYKKVPVALVGRVPVKVTLENGSIEVGDRITVSSIKGVGRLANDGEPVVGMALEPFNAEIAGNATVGRVLVLVK